MLKMEIKKICLKNILKFITIELIWNIYTYEIYLFNLF